MSNNFTQTTEAVERLTKDIQDYMKQLVKTGIYAKGGSENYVRTGDMLNSIQQKIEKHVTDTGAEYNAKIYFDTAMIRPAVASSPDQYNQHMSGKGCSKNPKPVNQMLPQWYDEGFRRGQEAIKLDILNKTKNHFTVDKVKAAIENDAVKIVTDGLKKFKK